MQPILPKIDVKPQVHKVVQVVSKPINTPQKKKKERISTVRLWLPGLMFFVGMILVLSQIIPLGLSFITTAPISASSEGFIPVTESFIKSMIEVNYYDPGASYFTAVVAEYKTAVVNTTYNRQMRISIPKVAIVNAALEPNVPGSDSALYDEVLKKGVAHLRGTALPGDKGISVIYGHSGISGMLMSRNNPQIIFSRLDGVSIGDTMSIQRDGKDLHYVVSGKKIVDPEDLNFMSETTSSERAVLLTCWPLGIGTKRLIVIADRIQ